MPVELLHMRLLLFVRSLHCVIGAISFIFSLLTLPLPLLGRLGPLIQGWLEGHVGLDDVSTFGGRDRGDER